MKQVDHQGKAEGKPSAAEKEGALQSQIHFCKADLERRSDLDLVALELSKIDDQGAWGGGGLGAPPQTPLSSCPTKHSPALGLIERQSCRELFIDVTMETALFLASPSLKCSDP